MIQFFLIVRPVVIFLILRFDIFVYRYLCNLICDRNALPVGLIINEIQDLFARLVVLLHNPLAREQLVTQILTVSYTY